MAINNGHSLLVCVLVTVCVLAPFAQAKDREVVYCDKKTDYDVKISGVEINPYPVKRGKSATFSISASTDIMLSGGTLKIDVAYFGLYIHSESHELCQETSCPATGDFVISHSQTLPGITPPGSYTLKLTLEDEKKQLTCINFDFSIGWWFAVDKAKAVADI